MSFQVCSVWQLVGHSARSKEMDDNGKVALREMKGLRFKVDTLRKSRTFFKDIHGFVEDVDQAARKCGFDPPRQPMPNLAPPTKGTDYGTKERRDREKLNPHKRAPLAKRSGPRQTKTAAYTHTVKAQGYDPAGLAICQICKNAFRVVTASHLKKHNLTVHEYEKKFPGMSRFAKKDKK